MHCVAIVVFLDLGVEVVMPLNSLDPGQFATRRDFGSKRKLSIVDTVKACCL